MALIILSGLLKDYLESLVRQGVINDQLAKLVNQKCLDDPDFIVRRICVYSGDAETLLLEMAHCIDLPDVDFSILAANAQKLHEESSWIGAEHVRLACARLIQSCVEKNRSKFSRELAWVEAEFHKTQSVLESIVQMEQRIIRLKK
ncbi:hypothetical protein Dimus_009406 [Dionaea muscipula]